MELVVLDLLLVLGLTLRLTRLIIADDLGAWWVREPAIDWAEDHPGRYKLVSGLYCPFCVGFWIGVASLASLALVGGPGDAHEVWRYIAGAFTLNWIVGHVAARMGDSD